MPGHIFHSVTPFANPYEINPICITGVDYSAVLITVKARSLTDVPHTLAVYGFSGMGMLANISIIHPQVLQSIHDNPFPLRSPPDSDSDGEDSGGSDGLVQPHGASGDVLVAPPPSPDSPRACVPAPAALDQASEPPRDLIVEMPRGITQVAVPTPFIQSSPLLTRPSNVDIQLFPGFYEVRASGEHGEQGLYRLPLQRAGDLGMLVANLASCSIRHLAGVSSVGLENAPSLSVDVICRDQSALPAEPLVLGVLDGVGALQLLDRPPPLPSDPSPVSRSARIAVAETPTYITILDKAAARKKAKLEGGSSSAVATAASVLPETELLQPVAEGLEPLPPPDVQLLAAACGVDPMELT